MKYIPAIDGLRAISIALVMVIHIVGERVAPGGYIGVDIFFVISGYLITGLLLTEYHRSGTISVPHFYARRIRRIWPAMLVVVAVVVAASLALPDDGSRIPTMIGAAAGITSTLNWVQAFGISTGGRLGPLWSLAIEEQFYLLWPAGLLLLLRYSSRATAVRLLILLAAATAVWRATLYLQGAPLERTYSGFDTHADPILIGCLLAMLSAGKAVIRPPHISVVLSCLFLFLLVFIAPRDGAFINLGGFTLVGVASAVLIASIAAGGLVSKLLSHWLLVFVGKRSYSLYLWHYPVNKYLIQFSVPSALRVVVAIALSFALAELTYRLVERPFLRQASLRPADAPPGPAPITNQAD